MTTLFRHIKNLPKYLIIGSIKFYRYFISPLLGHNCRFHPSCSQYCMECFEKLPPAVATYKSIIRLGKCHPFHEGGYDPLIVDSKDSEK